jgi:hypothetical protein
MVNRLGVVREWSGTMKLVEIIFGPFGLARVVGEQFHINIHLKNMSI